MTRRRRRPRPVGPNLKAKKMEQNRVTAMVNAAMKEKMGRGKQEKTHKPEKSALAHLGVKPPSSVPKTRKYPRLALLRPTRLPTGNHVVSLKVNLNVVTPEMMKKTEVTIKFPWGGAYKGKGRVRPTRENLGTKEGITVHVEYNPNQLPSRKGKGKIRIQTADAKYRVGLTEKTKWQFVELIRRIHSGKEEFNARNALGTFEVTMAEAELQK